MSRNESQTTLPTDQVSEAGSVEKKGGSKELEFAERVDEVYGKQVAGSPNYTNGSWTGSSILMMKTQIGLGVLSIPYVLETIGIIPGLIVILMISAITTYSNWVVGQWKQKHPATHSIADVGFVIGGKVGREVLGICYMLYMVLIVSSAMLSVSIAFNAITLHATCTVVFVIAGAIIMAICACVQTLEVLSWFGWIGVVSIVVSVFTLAIALSQGRPSAAPLNYTLNILWIANPTFAEASNAIATVVFSFGGVPSFFSIVAEMREPKHFNKAMLWCQSVVTSIYLIVGLIVYRYAAQFVTTPALGTAGPLLKRVCYGLALPSLLVAGILYTHLPAKYIFVRLLRGSSDLTSNSPRHWIYWITCVVSCIVVAYIVASAVPVFNGLIGVIGALLGTMMSMIVMSAMWFFDNWSRRATDKSLWFKVMVAWNVFVMIAGIFLMISGTYGSIEGIIATFATSSTGIFSCADNSV